MRPLLKLGAKLPPLQLPADHRLVFKLGPVKPSATVAASITVPSPLALSKVLLNAAQLWLKSATLVWVTLPPTGVAVGAGVFVAVGVGVFVGVSVTAGVFVGVIVGVGVNVLVGVLVGVAVGVLVGTLVGVDVGNTMVSTLNVRWAVEAVVGIVPKYSMIRRWLLLS